MAQQAADPCAQAIELCDAILALAAVQHTALRDGDLAAFLQIADQREATISALIAVIERSQSAVVRRGSDAHEVIRSRLAQILQADSENRRALEAALAETKMHLLAIGRGRRALQEYAHLQQQRDPIYVDRSS